MIAAALRLVVITHPWLSRWRIKEEGETEFGQLVVQFDEVAVP